MEQELTCMHANISKPIFITLQRGLLIQMKPPPYEERKKKMKIASTNIVYKPPLLHTGGRKKKPSCYFLEITTVVSHEQTHRLFSPRQLSVSRTCPVLMTRNHSLYLAV